MNIFWCQKNPLATKPKQLVANWPLMKKINLEGCVSINRRSKLHAVIERLSFFLLTFTSYGRNYAHGHERGRK